MNKMVTFVIQSTEILINISKILSSPVLHLNAQIVLKYKLTKVWITK